MLPLFFTLFPMSLSLYYECFYVIRWLKIWSEYMIRISTTFLDIHVVPRSKLVPHVTVWQFQFSVNIFKVIFLDLTLHWTKLHLWRINKYLLCHKNCYLTNEEVDIKKRSERREEYLKRVREPTSRNETKSKQQ